MDTARKTDDTPGLGDRARSPRSKGIALILIAGLLVLLVALAGSLLSMTQMHRRVSAHDVEAAHARLLGCSGYERARMELSRGTPISYGGEDYDGDGSPSPSAGTPEETEQTYRPMEMNIPDCPVEYAMRPTYAAPRGGRLPELTQADGRLRGFSGRLRGTLSDGGGLRGDTYALRIEDETGKINLNGGNLTRLLDNLGETLGVGAVGTAVAPSAPFDSVEDLATILPPDTYAAVAPFVTVDSWIDPDTLRPDPRSDLPWTTSGPLVSPPVLRWTWAMAKEPRAPVNINTAPPAVLKALLLHLDASVTEGDAMDPPAVEPGLIMGWRYMAFQIGQVDYRTRGLQDRLGNPGAIDVVLAGKIAGHIVAYRKGPEGPVETWEEFQRFLEAMNGEMNRRPSPRVPPPNGPSWEQIFTVLANADPNARINKFIPDAAAYAPIDKSDLRFHTTEFCFHGAGAYRIASAGRFCDGAGGIRSQARMEATLRLGGQARITTQERFESARDEGQDTTTYPEPVETGVQAASWDGRIGLSMPEPTGPENFSLTFTTSPSAETSPGSAGPHSPGGEWTTRLPGWDGSGYSATPLSEGGALAPDGMIGSWDGHHRLAFSQPRPDFSTADATIEMWVKKRHTDHPAEYRAFYRSNPSDLYSEVNWLGYMLRLKVPTSPDAAHILWDIGFRHSFAGMDGLHTNVHAAGGVLPGPSLPPAALCCYARIGGMSRAERWLNGEWHHIAFFRLNGMEQTALLIDGQSATGAHVIPSENIASSQWTMSTVDGMTSLTIGYSYEDNLQSANQCVSIPYRQQYGDMMIDHVRLTPAIKYGMEAALRAAVPFPPTYTTGVRGFPPPSRYILPDPLDPPYTTLGFGTGDIPPGSRLERLYWTERKPWRNPYGPWELQPAFVPDIHVRYAMDPARLADYVRVADLPRSMADPDGGGVRIASPSGVPVPMGNRFRVRFDFSSRLDPNNVTPFLEDVSVTFRHPSPRVTWIGWNPCTPQSPPPPAIPLPGAPVSSAGPLVRTSPRFADPQ